MSNSNTLFSVIVPVYNDDLHLPRCLDSILTQTYQEFECLLINDGSTDTCPIICDNYSKKDKRINVYHKKNEGISKTRQFGLDHAKGSYVLFIDSDDWIETSYFINIYQSIKDENADILYINFYNESTKGKQELYIQKPCVNDNDKVIKQILKGELYSCLWNIVFKKDFYINNKLKFNKSVNYGEDTLFIVEALFNKPTIKRINGTFYHHTFNINSFTQYDKKAKFIERINFINQFNELFDKYNRLDLKKYNFIPINDKYEMLTSGLFSREEYHKIYTLKINLSYIIQIGIRKFILLSLAETNLYYFARRLIIFNRKLKN